MPESSTVRDTSTIRVSRRTHAQLRALADAEHITLDELLTRMARSERQRRIGNSLRQPLRGDDNAVLDAGAETVTSHAGPW
jgi:hypothetical protein